MRYVLDASALLALLLDEPGAELVAEALDTACIGAVNLAEVATVLIRRPMLAEDVRATIESAPVPVLDNDPSLALEAGLLWPLTKSAGSSLGDRFGLVLARRLGATLLTGDRSLAAISPTVGVSSKMIR